MVRKHLLEWQWSDYVAKHGNRVNLLLHVVAVPLFQIGTVMLLYALIRVSGAAGALAIVCMVAALVAQGRGHKLERETPVPFDGPPLRQPLRRRAVGDVSRFVLSGRGTET